MLAPKENESDFSMNEFWIITQASIPVFLMMAVGSLLRWAKCFSEEAATGTLNLVVKALIPCLILDSVLGNAALKSSANLLMAPMLGIGTLLLGLLIGWASLRLAGLKKDSPDSKKRSFAVSVGLYNYGYIPFPLALALYDQNTVGVLFVFNVGVEVAVWTLVVACLSGYSPLKDWKKMFNMPLIALVFGLALNFLKADMLLPGALRSTFHGLGQCAYPLGLIVSGTIIYDLCRQYNLMWELRSTAVASALRCLLLPALILLAARFLPLTLELKRVVILQAAMPTAVFAMVLSQLYKADSGLAFRVVFLTTIISVISTPIWIKIGTLFLN